MTPRLTCSVLVVLAAALATMISALATSTPIGHRPQLAGRVRSPTAGSEQFSLKNRGLAE